MLNLNEALLDRQTNLGVLQAIEQGSCPGLRVLLFGRAHLDGEHCQVLTGILRRGGGVHLEELDLSHNDLGDEGVGTIMQAIVSAPSSSIKRLGLCHVSMERVGARALVHALDASLPQLRALDISSNPALGDQVMAIIIRALAAAAVFHHCWCQ